MEYQFIKDPIDGFRLNINDEHNNIARFLVEEIGINSQQVLQFKAQVLDETNIHGYELRQSGKELSLLIFDGEVSVKINHHAVDDIQLERFEQEMLSIESNNDVSECGLDDFLSLLDDWLYFLQDNAA